MLGITEIENRFYQGLKTLDKKIIESMPKSDIHNHAGRGGYVGDISKKIIPRLDAFNSLDDMQTWFEESVKVHIPKGAEGFLLRVEASFKQAQRDHIDRLALSFNIGDIDTLNGLENFIETIEALKDKYVPHGQFIPELSFLRSDISVEEIAQAKDVISSGYFKSIDVCGNENAAGLDRYKPIYSFAKTHHMQLKVHVGEFGTAQDIIQAVNLLDLDEVHHGIAAASSVACMKYLRDHKIILNICPMSNIMLKRVENYSQHPIRTLFDAGVPVTINTDDLTIFNASVTDEYMNLYKNKVFSLEELNAIRVNGLCAYNKYEYTGAIL